MSKLITVVLLLGTFLLAPKGWSQEGMETPSQKKTRQAITKFREVPASVGRDIRALKETAKTKLKTLGVRRSAQVAEDHLAMPLPKPERPQRPNGRSYSSAGKRDPFRPFVL